MSDHNIFVTAMDTFNSRRLAWACKDRDQADKIFAWVVEQLREVEIEDACVKITDSPWHPRNADHVHIYVVNENHRALRT